MLLRALALGGKGGPLERARSHTWTTSLLLPLGRYNTVPVLCKCGCTILGDSTILSGVQGAGGWGRDLRSSVAWSGKYSRKIMQPAAKNPEMKTSE